MTAILLMSVVMAYLIIMMIVPCLAKLGTKYQLVDVPHETGKPHTRRVPIVGGIALAVSVVITLALATFSTLGLSLLSYTALAGGVLLLITGIVHDKTTLRPFLLLSLQFCCAYFVVISGISFDGIFDLLLLPGLSPQTEKILSILFILLTVNAYNLIDGVDGLAVTLFIAAFGWLGACSLFLGNNDAALVGGVTAAALWGFLPFNTSGSDTIMLGKGGSSFIGFTLAALAIIVLESAMTTRFVPVVATGALSLLALPLMDAIRVLTIRTTAGRSPFSGDRSHLHHTFLQVDSSHRKVRKRIAKVALVIFAFATFAAYFLGIMAGVVGVFLSLGALFSVMATQNSMHRHRQMLTVLESPKRTDSRLGKI